MESNCKRNKGSSLLLLKFIEEQYLESFLDGNIYANNFGFFQKLESEYGIKGIGDKNDGCLPIYNLENLTVQNIESNEVVFTIPKVPVIRLSTEMDSKTAVFCLYDMALEDFEVIQDSENKLKLLMQFDDNKKEILRREFKGKTHVVIMDTLLFIDRLVKACDESGLSIVYDRVRYYQQGINDEKRLNDFNKNTTDKFFWKEEFFNNQKEFRVVFRNQLIDEGKNIVNVGDIRQIGFCLSVEELLEGKYELVYNIGSKKKL